MLEEKYGKSRARAGEVARTILNRTAFVAYCESWRIFPPCLNVCAYEIPFCSRTLNPRWQQYLDLFWALATGHPYLHTKQGFKHRLFASDPDLEELQLHDSWAITLARLSDFDFAHEIPDGVLAPLFREAADAVEKCAPALGTAKDAYLMCITGSCRFHCGASTARAR